MKRCLLALFALGAIACGSSLAANPVVVIKTSAGTIKVELFEKEAPATVKNFLKYTDDKHYDSTVFHRVIDGFMIQGGGFKKGFGDARTLKDIESSRKKTGDAVKNESSNGLSNKKYTLAMARTNDPDSATDQFYINVKDNTGLDRKSAEEPGYCVFGKVTEGEAVVDKIKKVATRDLPVKDRFGRPIFKDVPEKEVVIESIRREGK